METLTRLLPLILCIALLLCGCIGPGAQDWESEPLAKDYVLVRSSVHNISLGQGNDGLYTTVVPPEVRAVACDEAFICLQQVDMPDAGAEVPEDAPVYYYIVVVADGQVYGPCSETEYAEKVQALGVPELPWRDVQTFRP